MSNPPTHAPTRRSTSPSDDQVDPREIDKVLVELAGMASRWNVFKKYVAENLSTHDEVNGFAASEDVVFFDSTTSFAVFEHLLSSYYVPLELWYIRTIIGKVLFTV